MVVIPFQDKPSFLPRILVSIRENLEMAIFRRVIAVAKVNQTSSAYVIINECVPSSNQLRSRNEPRLLQKLESIELKERIVFDVSVRRYLSQQNLWSCFR